MATDFTPRSATDAVTASFAGTPDPRLRQIMTSLTRHLHDFVRDVRPTPEEWRQAIDFLTATGQACTGTRQEFILLSDILGVSMLVEAINEPPAEPSAAEPTAPTVLGPFHVDGSPQRDLDESIDLVGAGEPCVIAGRVLSADGTPLPGARLDVWQADHQGCYDVQQPDVQPEGNGRGRFTADADGGFRFRSCVPSAYPIPTDGPVGALLTRTGRHPYRPAHIHIIAEAAGHHPLTTHIFVAGSPYLDSDAVFAVKESLVKEFTPVDDPQEAERYGIAGPFRSARFDIVLRPVP